MVIAIIIIVIIAISLAAWALCRAAAIADQEMAKMIGEDGK